MADVDVDVDIDSDAAVSINWRGCFEMDLGLP